MCGFQYSKLFNWFSYVLFIYNGYTSIVTAILRIAKTLLISLLLLFRLDKVIFPSDFQSLDGGMLKYTYMYSSVCLFVVFSSVLVVQIIKVKIRRSF